MFRRLRHIACFLFLLLCAVIVTPVQFLHDCHDDNTELSHCNDGQAEIGKVHYNCPVCDLHVSQFIESHTEYSFLVPAMPCGQHIIYKNASGTDSYPLPDNKGPPAIA